MLLSCLESTEFDLLNLCNWVFVVLGTAVKFDVLIVGGCVPFVFGIVAESDLLIASGWVGCFFIGICADN